MPIKERIGALIRTYAIITFGLIIYSISWTSFLLPSQITGGGISGLAALIFYATGFPIGVSVLIFNAILIAIPIRVIGFSFGLKTIFGVVVMAFFLSLFQLLIKGPVVTDRFMASVIGGILGGLGIGIVFTQGGSSGGTDIIAMFINKYKNYSPGRIILYCDVIIITSSYLIFHSLEIIVYGYVTMVVSSYVIDNVLAGSRQSFQVFIFSKEHEKIATRIASELKRGVTVLDGQGWYSKQPMKVLMILVRKNESTELLRIVKQEDPKAFISMGSVMGVYGQGFDRLKT
ncbi:MAG TPA: YitT family protein [Bacteroidales bacterium]